MKPLQVLLPSMLHTAAPRAGVAVPRIPTQHPQGYRGQLSVLGDSSQGLPSRESFNVKASADLMSTRVAPKCAGNTHTRKNRCLGTTSVVTSHDLVVPGAGPGQGRACECGQCAQAGAVPWQRHSLHAVRGGGSGGPLPTSPLLLALRPGDAFEGWARGSGEGLRSSLGQIPTKTSARNTGS